MTLSPLLLLQRAFLCKRVIVCVLFAIAFCRLSFVLRHRMVAVRVGKQSGVDVWCFANFDDDSVRTLFGPDVGGFISALIAGEETRITIRHGSDISLTEHDAQHLWCRAVTMEECSHHSIREISKMATVREMNIHSGVVGDDDCMLISHMPRLRKLYIDVKADVSVRSAVWLIHNLPNCDVSVTPNRLLNQRGTNDSLTTVELATVQGGDFIFEGNLTHVRSFSIGVCEVSQAQYESITGKNCGRFRRRAGVVDADHFWETSHLPIDLRRMCDAAHFCNILSEQHGLQPYYSVDFEQRTATILSRSGNGYRLPTDVEWEFALDGADVRDRVKDRLPERTCYGQPNRFGIFQMGDNEYEWCFPSGSDRSDGVYRDSRGWQESPTYCGFRVSRNLEPSNMMFQEK